LEWLKRLKLQVQQHEDRYCDNKEPPPIPQFRWIQIDKQSHNNDILCTTIVSRYTTSKGSFVMMNGELSTGTNGEDV
jgi:hypothetical protein